MLEEYQKPHGRAERVALLGDLLQLFEVLLSEVPTPLGCSNPGCVRLEGESERKAAGKVCTGCKVAWYCGRECQVAHWKVHKGVCKRLQQQE